MISSKEVELFLARHPNKNDFVLQMFVESALSMKKQRQIDDVEIDSLPQNQANLNSQESPHVLNVIR